MIKSAGTITLNNKAIVSDPCYSVGTWCQSVIEDVLPGEYKCFYIFDEEEEAISAIHLCHTSLSNEQAMHAVENADLISSDIGVDSGMAGIYDFNYYKSKHEPKIDDEWYENVYKATIKTEPNPHHHGFLNDSTFISLIDNYINDLKRYLKPEDCTLIGFLIEREIAARFGSDDRYEKFVIERLNAQNFWIDNPEKRKGKTSDNIEQLLTNAENELARILRLFDKTNMKYIWRFINKSIRIATTIDNLGFVSPSGFGDGSYECWCHTNENGKKDLIDITFF